MAGELTIGEAYAVSVPVATLWTSPEAPRSIDLPAVEPAADVRCWTDRLDTSDRLDLHGRVDSQVLLGEEVLVDQIIGDWVRVVVPGQPSTLDARGYPGWLPGGQIAPRRSASAVGASVAASVVVTALTADAYEQPGGAVALRDLSFGTVLVPAAGRGKDVPGWVAVEVPGRDGAAWLRSSQVDAFPSGAGDGQWLVAAAGVFLGLAYLWGGRSGLGVDCSGLVHLVHQRFGVTLPRDAHDQAAGGAEVDVESAAPGDLYFFAGDGTRVSHVGFAAGDGRILHAPETGRGVELVSMPDDRRRALVSVRRYWG